MTGVLVDGSLNVGEYGQVLRFNVGEDISAATITLSFQPPNETIVDKLAVDGVVVPAQNITINNSNIFVANQYAEYTIEDGLINKVGTWKIRLTAEFADPSVRKTDWVTFVVKQ